MNPKTDNAVRYVPPGSCSWCGHQPHDSAECPSAIRAKDADSAPCPCRKRVA